MKLELNGLSPEVAREMITNHIKGKLIVPAGAGQTPEAQMLSERSFPYLSLEGDDTADVRLEVDEVTHIGQAAIESFLNSSGYMPRR